MQTLRRQARIYALQLLYQADIDPGADAPSRERYWSEGRASKKARAFATELVETTLAHRERLDASLTEALEQWKLSRLPVLVRNVLRLAACELLVIAAEPPAAIINEAVELTRTYMDEESARFVNSVLDHVRLRAAGEGAEPPQAAGSP
ncbi:MAG TPA: transcription antitermination factor NusB [bacterium]|nr:transcription antitermination factor NusB [bacterium]